MLKISQFLVVCFISFWAAKTDCSFVQLFNKVRVNTLKSLPKPIKRNVFQPKSNYPRTTQYIFPKTVTPYEKWPKAFIQLRDLVYGKYNYVNQAFAPIVHKGVAMTDVEKFPRQYINVPYVEKPTPYQRGWQVTNRTLLKTIIDQTANKHEEAYTEDEQKDLVEIALDKGADPFYDPVLEKKSDGYSDELSGNALEIAIKLKNVGALEALINYLYKNDLLQLLDPTLKSQMSNILKSSLKNASNEQKNRIDDALSKLASKKVEAQNDYETLD